MRPKVAYAKLVSSENRGFVAAANLLYCCSVLAWPAEAQTRRIWEGRIVQNRLKLRRDPSAASVDGIAGGKVELKRSSWTPHQPTAPPCPLSLFLVLLQFHVSTTKVERLSVLFSLRVQCLGVNSLYKKSLSLSVLRKYLFSYSSPNQVTMSLTSLPTGHSCRRTTIVRLCQSQELLLKRALTSEHSSVDVEDD